MMEDNSAFRQIIENMAESVLVLDKQTIRYANKAAARMTGCSVEELIGDCLSDIVVEEDRADIPAWLDHLFDTDGIQGSRIETRFIERTQNKPFHVSLEFRAISQPDGANLTFVTVQNQSRYKALLHEHRKTEEEFQQVMSQMPDMFYRTDSAGLVTMVTPACAEVLGFSQEELIGTPLADLYELPEQRDEVVRQLIEANGKTIRVEAKLLHRTGRPIWFSTQAFLRFDEEGKPAGVVGVARDHTDIRAEFEDLEIVSQIAQEANLEKTRFLAAASHDLRQPLHAMGLLITVMQMAMDDADPDPARLSSLLGKIDKAQRDMSDMLNAILDISRIHAETMKPNIQTFNVASVLVSVKDTFEIEAEERGLDLRLVSCNLEIVSDPVLLQRILNNLLSNALRYTPSGKVLIGCRRYGNSLSIEVCDTGIGIATSDQEIIFEDFKQIDNPESQKVQGLGLGLAVVDKVSGLLDHKVLVHSIPGRGSRFCIEVPLAQSAFDESQKERMARLIQEKRPLKHEGNGQTVLVMDDDLQILDSLEILLQTWGYEVLCATCGEDALQECKVANIIPDLILSDYTFSGRTPGNEVVAWLYSELGTEIPAIIITGDTSIARIKQAADSGLPVLHKPLDPEHLKSAIRTLLSE